MRVVRAELSRAARRVRQGWEESARRATSCGLVTGNMARAELWSGDLEAEVMWVGNRLAMRGTQVVNRGVHLVARLAWGDAAELRFGRPSTRHGAKEDRSDVARLRPVGLGEL